MKWTVSNSGGPRRVNHAAVFVSAADIQRAAAQTPLLRLGDNDNIDSIVRVKDCILSFGGFCSGLNFRNFRQPMDVFCLDVNSYRWKWLTLSKRDRVKRYRLADGDSTVRLPAWPFQRYGHTAVLRKADGKVYIFGGINDSHSVLLCNRLFVFNPATMTWDPPVVVAGQVRPRGCDGHSACMINDSMYIYGGADHPMGTLSSDVFRLDFSTMTWTKIDAVYIPGPDLPEGLGHMRRDFHTATPVHHGSSDADPTRRLIYVFGGRKLELDVDETNLNRFVRRNMALIRPGVEVANSPGSESESDDGVPANGQDVFVVTSLLELYPNDMHTFDPVSGVWHCIDPSIFDAESLPIVRPAGRRSHTCVSVNDGRHLLLFGGFNSIQSVETYFNDMWLFDTATAIWKRLDLPQSALRSGVPCARRRHVCCYVEGDVAAESKLVRTARRRSRRLFIFGGTCPNQHMSSIQFTDRERRMLPPFVFADLSWNRLELADLHVLDFSPNLTTLATLAVIDSRAVDSDSFASVEARKEDDGDDSLHDAMQRLFCATPAEIIDQGVRASDEHFTLPQRVCQLICNMSSDNCISQPLQFVRSQVRHGG